MFTNRIVADSRCQKVGGDEFGSLVYMLVKRMLSVGTRLSPDDGSRLIGQFMASSVYRLAVAFHISLLKIGWKTVQVLVIGQDCLRLGAEKIGVPDTNQGQQDRNIFLKRRGSEMLIHLIGPLEQIAKIIKSDIAGYG